MAESTIKGEQLSSEEFRRELAQAFASANPVDDLLGLSKRLNEYEKKYEMSSAAFYQQYQAGLLDDTLQHCVEWAALYDLFQKTKRVLEAALMRTAVQAELTEAV